VAVSVARSDAVLAHIVLGYRDLERQLPVTPSTTFPIGSLTKAFTATAALAAEADGLLQLERPLNGGQVTLSLKDMEARASVSLEDILTHRVGLPPHDLLWHCSEALDDSLPERLGFLEPIPNGFRRGFAYSNLLYGAVARLIQQLTGRTWCYRPTSSMSDRAGCVMAITGMEPRCHAA
jgi:CubicO group peptidase (beta-lactamase class C family)